MFKPGKLWVFKHFHGNKDLLKAPMITIIDTDIASSSIHASRAQRLRLFAITSERGGRACVRLCGHLAR